MGRAESLERVEAEGNNLHLLPHGLSALVQRTSAPKWQSDLPHVI